MNLKNPDEFRIPVETGKIPIELTAQMKWNIAETISRIHDDGIALGAGDFVDADDLKYICQAASYLMLYAQQLEAEREAAVKDIEESQPCFACKHFNRNAGNCGGGKRCLRLAEIAMRNGGTYKGKFFEWRGVQKEE